MNHDFDTYVMRVLRWAEDRNLIEGSDPKTQMLKCVSEVGELADAVAVDDHEEIIDAFGDVLVTMIILAEMKNLDLLECLESAYNTIAPRRGKMVNGVFVKE